MRKNTLCAHLKGDKFWGGKMCHWESRLAQKSVKIQQKILNSYKNCTNDTEDIGLGNKIKTCKK